MKKFHLFLLHYALNRMLDKFSDAKIPVDIFSWHLFDESSSAELFIDEDMCIEVNRKAVVFWDGFTIVNEISLIQFKFDFRDRFIKSIIKHYRNRNIFGEITLN